MYSVFTEISFSFYKGNYVFFQTCESITEMVYRIYWVSLLRGKTTLHSHIHVYISNGHIESKESVGYKLVNLLHFCLLS